jgi:hypothetical protein
MLAVIAIVFLQYQFDSLQDSGLKKRGYQSPAFSRDAVAQPDFA